jgi:hypothetical protein
MAWLLSILLAITVSPDGWDVFLPPPPPATTLNVSQSYEIVATLDPDAGVLDAVETVQVTNQATFAIDHLNLSALPRAFGYLRLPESISVDGKAARTSWTTTTNLRVQLPERLRSGESAEIRVPFRLTVGSSGGAFTARLSRDRGVISFGQWFPILSREHDSYGVGDAQVTRSADRIRLQLSTTRPLARDAVACPGLQSAPAGSGSAWVCETQDVRDFSFVVNPAFRLTTRQEGDTAIRVYTQTVDGNRTADMIRGALAGMNRAFGPYPWPDLMVAEVGADGGFSMEYPAAIHLTRTKVTDPYVINHEVAHQWFYAQLGNDQMLEPWLDEGLSDFSARYLMGTNENQCSGRDVDSAVFDWPAGATTGGDWLSCDGYFHTVFYKSTEFLNAVRAAMGEEAFFAAMREYVADHQHGLVTASDLLDHLQASTDADLQPIYARYLGAY